MNVKEGMLEVRSVRLQSLSPCRNRRLHSLPSAIDRSRYTLPLFSFAPTLVRLDLQQDPTLVIGAFPSPVPSSFSSPSSASISSAAWKTSSATQIRSSSAYESDLHRLDLHCCNPPLVVGKSSRHATGRRRPNPSSARPASSSSTARPIARSAEQRRSTSVRPASRPLLARRLRPLAVRQRDWPLAGDPEPTSNHRRQR
ncbi:hypothetical protein ACLOJK_041361 [Asimina triloba]